MGTLPRDDNSQVLRGEDFIVTKKTMTFAGETTNDPGDFDGTGNPATLFVVDGIVLARVIAFCETSLAGANATLSVGTAKSAASIIAQSTGTDIDASEIWHDATPDNDVEAFTVAPQRIVAGDIIQTVGTANITAGVITYYCLWRPISEGATVTAA